MRYRNLLPDREALATKLDALNLMQRFRFQITFAAMRAANHRHIFYDQEMLSFAVGPGDPADLRAFFPANLTYHKAFPFHKVKL